MRRLSLQAVTLGSGGADSADGPGHRNREVGLPSFKGYSKKLELEIPVLGDLLFTAHAAARSPARAGAGFARNSLVRRAGNGKHRQKLLDLGA
jgi:hypothetical protein